MKSPRWIPRARKCWKTSKHFYEERVADIPSLQVALKATGGAASRSQRRIMCLECRSAKLAVDEAKAWDEALTEGVAQAKNYAGKLSVRYAYATNGQGIYAIDMQTQAKRAK